MTSDRTGGRDAAGRIAADHEQVRQVAGLDDADLVGQAEQFGRPRGGGHDGLHGGRARADQQLELVVHALPGQSSFLPAGAPSSLLT